MKKTILLLILFSCAIKFANAQWQNLNGPYETHGLLKYGNNLFALSSIDGPHMTQDDGITWIEIGVGILPKHTYSLAVMGKNLFAGGAKGIFLSTDTGANWQHLNVDTNSSIYCLFVKGSDIYAAGYINGTNKVIKSNDTGKTWANNFNDDFNFMATLGDNIFASSSFQTYLSTDNGVNWLNVSSGGHLAVNNTQVFVANDYGIYESQDTGKSWKRIDSVAWLTSVVADDSNIFGSTTVSVFFSNNNGFSWGSITNNVGMDVNRLQIFDDNLYASTTSGVWRRKISDLKCLNNSYFTVLPDSTTPHHWFAVNYASGTAPLTYIWNWGDGDTSMGATPSHIYSDSGYYKICLTVIDSSGCINTYCDSSTYIRQAQQTMISINVITPNQLGIKDQQQNNFSIKLSPNPAHENFTIEIDDDQLFQSSKTLEKLEIKIFNVLGENLLTEKLNNKKQTINCKNLSSGIYFYQVKNEKEMIGNGKIVIEQ